MNRSEQIVEAALLGLEDFEKGKKCVPAHNFELMGMLDGRSLGVTPGGEASSIEIMKAYSTSWHSANVAEIN